ncbi:NAD(P)-dependent alcohol dehydrogenase [Anaeromyxobacter oryzae]|uniref:Oxidoreductase n=1 Tax=Anaeromyxobacter oryzae TaxID=2918170 RepID=A0ABN6MMG3_9BACT|nr:NAD(P)-dependent alcohol dehydrogenase [Anaeromyxobacter oryzae]BDG02141.1 oxidoreductase [Anaeromyxobacter oryzae]
MKIVEYDAYGPPDVLRIRDVARPRPGRGALLVRVRAAALNPKDVLVRSGRFRLLTGRRFPKRVGFDWAGEIAGVGAGVAGIAEGASYYGMLDGYQGGACAEYLVASPRDCAPMPAGLDFVRAAAIPLAASTALQALRDVARLVPGARVLVNGASGGVGSFAIQVARILGAHVTATASAPNLDLCRRLGAHEAIDYGAADALAAPARYDVVLDVFGNRSLAAARRALGRSGVYVTTVPKLRTFVDTALTLVRSPRARTVVVRPRARDLVWLAERVAEGRLVPVVEQEYPLERIAEAEAHAGSKHVRGKIVVRID